MKDPRPKSPPVRLRCLRAADLPLAQAIAARAFNRVDIGADVRSTLEVYFRSGLECVPLGLQANEALPREFFAVVNDDEGQEMVGLTGIYRLGRWTWSGNLWLGWTAVDKDLQGRGLGTQMLHLVFGLARARGAQYLKVETAYGGRSSGFYARNGFVEEARLVRHYAPDLDAAVWSRTLADIEPASTTAEGQPI